MKNTFGQSIAYTLFGESHGEEIGIIIDGLAPGVKIDEDYIRLELSRRRPSGNISTGRVEADNFRIVSGVMNGRSTGTPICILIPNTNTKSGDYSKLAYLPRPGHADYSATCKYHGFQDYRGGGHFSGRLTAPIVAAGAIMKTVLAEKGIFIGTHIKKLAGIADRGFDSGNLKSDINTLRDSNFPVLDREFGDKMREEAEKAALDGDSVGGVLETVVIGMPSGVGEPWFDSVESVLSHALFSIPAVKGVEFGDGFALADMRGSCANDSFYTDGKTVSTKTNHNGGINGGITNGMPIIFRLAIKPTPSIYKEQDTVNLHDMKNTRLKIEGRHDPSIVHRAAPVTDAVTAMVLCDLLAGRFGTDHLK
ncbi:MAG: chorismate synthase [Clostridia bacterium]|nr:chorismate synthase [Clostridia bacterium]